MGIGTTVTGTSRLQQLTQLRALVRAHLTAGEAAGVAVMEYEPRVHDEHAATRFGQATLARSVPGGLILVRLDDDPELLHQVVLHELGHHLTLHPSGRFHVAFTRLTGQYAHDELAVRRGLIEGAADAVALTAWGSPPCPTYERRAREDTRFGRGYGVGRGMLLTTPAPAAVLPV